MQRHGTSCKKKKKKTNLLLDSVLAAKHIVFLLTFHSAVQEGLANLWLLEFSLLKLKRKLSRNTRLLPGNCNSSSWLESCI